MCSKKKEAITMRETGKKDAQSEREDTTERREGSRALREEREESRGAERLT